MYVWLALLIWACDVTLLYVFRQSAFLSDQAQFRRDKQKVYIHHSRENKTRTCSLTLLLKRNLDIIVQLQTKLKECPFGIAVGEVTNGESWCPLQCLAHIWWYSVTASEWYGAKDTFIVQKFREMIFFYF